MENLIYKAHTRGQANLGWLHSFHTFSFARYFNPNRMGFGTLRVINDDTIAPSSGFGNHGHRDMEIISVPLYGELRHKDNMNHIQVISHDEVQVMSAGTGIMHSEFNNSNTERANFLQIWIQPKLKGVAPHYDQKKFDIAGKKNGWVLMVSPDAREDSLRINQDAFLSRGLFEKGQWTSYTLEQKNHGLYLMNLSGHFKVIEDGQSFELEGRDGIALWDFDNIELFFEEDSEVLAIEVPMF